MTELFESFFPINPGVLYRVFWTEGKTIRIIDWRSNHLENNTWLSQFNDLLVVEVATKEIFFEKNGFKLVARLVGGEIPSSYLVI